MSHRMSHRSPHDETKGLIGPGGLANNDHERVPPLPVRRVSVQRAHATLERLTPFETTLIAHLAVMRCATRQQLGQLQPGEQSAAAHTRRVQRSLSKLVDERVIARLERPIGGPRGGSRPPLYCLDVIGARLAGVDTTSAARRPRLPGSAHVAHTLAVGDLYVAVIHAQRAGTLELIGFATEPECWRHATGPDGQPVTLKPDAYLHLATAAFEQRTFAEIDLGTESVPTIVHKAGVYARYYATGVEQRAAGIFPEVLWVVTTQRRHDALTSAFGELRDTPAGLHRVIRRDQITTDLLRTPED